MFLIPFGLAVKQLRLRKKLSQRALAAAMGIKPTRLCKIESCIVPPTPVEQEAARQSLGGIRAYVMPCRVAKTLAKNARRSKPKRKLFEPARDRPS